MKRIVLLFSCLIGCSFITLNCAKAQGGQSRSYDIDSLINKEIKKFNNSQVYYINKGSNGKKVSVAAFRKKFESLKAISFTTKSSTYHIIAQKDSFMHENWHIKGNSNKLHIIDLYSVNGTYGVEKMANHIKSEFIRIERKQKPFLIEFSTSNIGELQSLKIDDTIYYIVYGDPVLGLDRAMYTLKMYMDKNP